MDTVKRIAKRMSPKENRKSYKEECFRFPVTSEERIIMGKGFPYGKGRHLYLSKTAVRILFTVTSGRLTNGFLRLFRT